MLGVIRTVTILLLRAVLSSTDKPQVTLRQNHPLLLPKLEQEVGALFVNL